MTGTGAEITITYASPQCSRLSGNMPASPQTNTMACFPVYGIPAGGSGQIQDWFTKTLVSQVDTSDQTQTKAPSPDQVTSYSDQQGAAEHHDDLPVIKSSNRTWDQYRGFGQVIVTTGTAPDPVTKTGYIYFQGMDGDNNGSGGTKSASVQDTNSESYVDRNWLADSVLETDTYTQAGSSTITSKVINAAAWVGMAVHPDREPGRTRQPADADRRDAEPGADQDPAGDSGLWLPHFQDHQVLRQPGPGYPGRCRAVRVGGDLHDHRLCHAAEWQRDDADLSG